MITVNIQYTFPMPPDCDSCPMYHEEGMNPCFESCRLKHGLNPNGGTANCVYHRRYGPNGSWTQFRDPTCPLVDGKTYNIT